MKVSEKFEIAMLVFGATTFLIAPNRAHACDATLFLTMAAISGWFLSKGFESASKK